MILKPLPAAICAVLFCSPLSIFCQTPSPINVDSPTKSSVIATKDTAAVGVLTSLTASQGWLPPYLPQDVQITGTVTRNMDGAQPADFLIKLRGPSQFSYTEAGRTFLTNGLTGVISSPDGKVSRIPAHSAAAALAMLFPPFSIVPEFAGSDVELSSFGAQVMKGCQCIGVRIVHRYGADDIPGKIKSLSAPIELWVDKNSGRLFRADYFRIAINNHSAALRETTYFSDYRTVNGVSVPFRQDIFLNDNLIKTLQFTSVKFNVGLTDADFDMKALLAGAR